MPKKVEKKRRAKVPVKRRFKVRVIAQPMSINPTLPADSTLSTEPIPTVATVMATTQTLVARTTATTATEIPATVYNLEQGKFKGIPYPTKRLEEEEGPHTPAVTSPLWSSNPKLQPLSQPHITGRTPHGLIPCLLSQSCLKLGHLGQFSQWKLPKLLRWKRHRRRLHPE